MAGPQLPHPGAPSLPTGFFAYTYGCLVVVEDLHSGAQQHWPGHSEEISTLALSHDAQVLILCIAVWLLGSLQSSVGHAVLASHPPRARWVPDLPPSH